MPPDLQRLGARINPAPVPSALLLPTPARLSIDLDALAANWRLLSSIAGHPVGAVVKADGYGLGARAVLLRLATEGLTDAFVGSWREADLLGAVPDSVTVHVLHGVQREEGAFASSHFARPVLNSPEQCALWRQIAPERACALMVDTGMNRLGLVPSELDAAGGLAVDLLMSHLACADEPGHPMTVAQAARFAGAKWAGARRSLVNSAGLFDDASLALDLARPGLALYGGVPHPAAAGRIATVARISAEVLQLRSVIPGETIGYGATYKFSRPSRVAIIGLGYADGVPPPLSAGGHARVDGILCPVVGRVSMDLIAIDVTDAPPLAAGDWIDFDFDLAATSAVAGRSQYELLTGLGQRFDRRYVGRASQ